MAQDSPDEEFLTLISDLNKICRSCLNKNGSINLFHTEYKGLLLCDLFTVFCKVDAKESDGFPQNICDNCADFIIQFYIFKEKVHSSYVTLEEALGKENSFLKKKTQKVPENNCSEDAYAIEETYIITKEEEEEEFIQNDDECFTDNSESSKYEIPDNSEPSKYEVSDNFETTQIETKIDDNDTLTCSFCRITFTSESIYTLHMDKENELRKEETCKICEQLVSKPKLKGHLQEHAKNNEIVCKVCSRTFSHPWHLAKHIPIHFKKLKEQCHICGKTFNKINIEDHIRQHYGEKNISCDICDAKFITRKALLRHKYDHKLETGEIIPQICKICGKIVKKGRLSTHMEKHRKKSLCNECGKEFSEIGNLKRHIENVHRKIKPYKCHICNAAFGQKTSLMDHLRVHSKERPFLCSECGKTFKKNTYLNLHIKTKHRDFIDSKGRRKAKEDPDKLICTCEYCGKKFDYPYRLKIHMQQHSGDRPYSCHLCHKTFKQNNSLQVHLQYHEDSQLFICDLCPKSYISLVALKLHRAKMHTHRQRYYKEKGTGNDLEKPYACPGCPRKFMYRWNLKKHVKVHEKENRFSCDICFEIFSDSEKVEIHKTDMHETHTQETVKENHSSDSSEDSNLYE